MNESPFPCGLPVFVLGTDMRKVWLVFISRRKISEEMFVSPDTRLVASERKTTRLVAEAINGWSDGPLPFSTGDPFLSETILIFPVARS